MEERAGEIAPIGLGKSRELQRAENIVFNSSVFEEVVQDVLFDDGRTTVLVLDEPGQGGACHKYVILNRDTREVLGVISFQDGPIDADNNGVNGVTQENLMAILRHRLQHFQKGEYACRENAVALTKLEESTMWLNKRTADRQRRGVEGTHEK